MSASLTWRIMCAEGFHPINIGKWLILANLNLSRYLSTRIKWRLAESSIAMPDVTVSLPPFRGLSYCKPSRHYGQLHWCVDVMGTAWWYGNGFCMIELLWVESTNHDWVPLTLSFYIFFVIRLNKLLKTVLSPVIGDAMTLTSLHNDVMCDSPATWLLVSQLVHANNNRRNPPPPPPHTKDHAFRKRLQSWRHHEKPCFLK